MKRAAKITFALIILVVLLLGAAWVTSPDPQLNEASFEDEALVATIAPIEEAITLAQFRGENGEIRTMQVVDWAGETVTGIDLSEMGGEIVDDPFAALASISEPPESAGAIADFPRIEMPVSSLLATGSNGRRHIGTGTNFPEHAEEANSDSVFQFPKFGPATPARTTVAFQPGILLDYEIELCMRFDRDVSSEADFDAAVKGIFLCGDFTNRNALVELADPDNLDSGYGFSDAKSGPDFFPTGPLLVIPKDWPSFVDNLRMTTAVNGEARQDARGSEMTMDFRQLAAKSLADMSERRFQYQDGFEFLAPDQKISTSMTLMSGTAEGVIFVPPTRGDMIEGLFDYLMAGGPMSDQGLIDTVKQTFIRNELESGHFLQPGDNVHYRSSLLGDIKIKVVE